jgi:hypothetical protein
MPWYRAHHKFSTPGDQQSIDKHNALVDALQFELETKGYTVQCGDENWFRLDGPTTTFAGKPDLIAISPDGSSGTIYEVKGGGQRDYYHYQAMMYMWATPIAWKKWRHIKFEGVVLYDDHPEPVSSDRVDQDFIDRMAALIKRAAAPIPAVKKPSYQECRFCKLSKEQCPEKVEELTEGEGYAKVDIF